MSAEAYPLEQPKTDEPPRNCVSYIPLYVFLLNLWGMMIYVVFLLHKLDNRMTEVLLQASTSTEYVLMKKEL